MPFNTQRTSPSPTSRLGGGGLDYITSSTFTTASTVSVDGCFTSTYDNYRLVARIYGSVNDQALTFRMRVGGVDASGANYGIQRLNVASTTLTGAQSLTQTSGRLIYYQTTDNGGFTADILGPALSAFTIVTSQGIYTAPNIEINYTRHDVATAYDGISLIPASGNITGTVTVYGYRKA